MVATLFPFSELSLRRLWDIDKRCPGVSCFSVLRKGAAEGHGPAVDVTPGASQAFLMWKREGFKIKMAEKRLSS